MRVTLSQVETGMLHYIDSEFASNETGLKKFVIMLAAGMVSGKAEALMAKLPFSVLGDDGRFEFEDVKKAAHEALDKMGGRFTQDIPMIGSVTFGADDIERIAEAVYHS